VTRPFILGAVIGGLCVAVVALAVGLISGDNDSDLSGTTEAHRTNFTAFLTQVEDSPETIESVQIKADEDTVIVHERNGEEYEIGIPSADGRGGEYFIGFPDNSDDTLLKVLEQKGIEAEID
jgi:hypothetical protein